MADDPRKGMPLANPTRDELNILSTEIEDQVPGRAAGSESAMSCFLVRTNKHRGFVAVYLLFRAPSLPNGTARANSTSQARQSNRCPAQNKAPHHDGAGPKRVCWRLCRLFHLARRARRRRPRPIIPTMLANPNTNADGSGTACPIVKPTESKLETLGVISV